MRKLLNTLYVLTPESYLRKDGENVVVEVDGEERFRCPIHNLEGIVTFTYSGASCGVVMLCAQYGVKISYMTPSGKFVGSFYGPIKGNVLLRRAQYRMADNPLQSKEIAACCVAAKVHNQRAVLQRFLRDYPQEEPIHSTFVDAIDTLSAVTKKLSAVSSCDEVRGIEGDSARIYFGLFHTLLLNDSFVFVSRVKHPPTDPINALLSFFYSLLSHEVRSALEAVGLDPYVGFLHADRPGRHSLALDLMEELRAYVVDRFVLTLVNRRQVAPSDFIEQAEQSVMLKEPVRKALIGLWQKRKREVITHPFTREKMELGLLPYVQAQLFARFVRGDLDGYPPFLMT